LGAVRQCALNRALRLANLLLDASSTMTPHSLHSSSHWHEVLLGRSLAACVHPIAAWQSKTRSFRVMLVAGYFVAAYLAALTAIAIIT